VRAAVFALTVLLTTSSAYASSTFPAVVTKVVPAAKVTCESCHRTLDGGSDLAPFGASLKARGAIGKDDASLEAALAKMKTDSVDSDGDGARDLDELSWGGDPNVADLPPTPAEEPSYGVCSVGHARATTPLVLLGVLLALARFRKTRPAGSRASTRGSRRATRDRRGAGRRRRPVRSSR
jgi:hypothetical protein